MHKQGNGKPIFMIPVVWLSRDQLFHSILFTFLALVSFPVTVINTHKKATWGGSEGESLSHLILEECCPSLQEFGASCDITSPVERDEHYEVLRFPHCQGDHSIYHNSTPYQHDSQRHHSKSITFHPFVLIGSQRSYGIKSI